MGCNSYPEGGASYKMALTTGETTYSQALETQVIYLHALTTMFTTDNTGASSSWWQTNGMRLRKTPWSRCSQAVDVTTSMYRSDAAVCK